MTEIAQHVLAALLVVDDVAWLLPGLEQQAVLDPSVVLTDGVVLLPAEATAGQFDTGRLVDDLGLELPVVVAQWTGMHVQLAGSSPAGTTGSEGDVQPQQAVRPNGQPVQNRRRGV